MKAPSQCQGITKSGKRCSITSKSDMKDNGRLVCEPLLNGGKFCLYHTVIFNHFHVKVDDAIVVYLDFETTGLDVMEHNIVEINLVEHSNSAVFSTVVCPPLRHTFLNSSNVCGCWIECQGLSGQDRFCIIREYLQLIVKTG